MVNNKDIDKITNTVEAFFKQYRLQKYKAGEVVIHMLDEPGGIYYLKQGFVKMNTIFTNGNELTVNIFKPGSFFPMTWGLADTVNNYTFQAITDIGFHKAPKKETLAFLETNPQVLFDLTKRILSGMDGLITNFTNLTFGSAVSRVAYALLLCVKRFGKEKNGAIELDIRLTHQDLANLAGLTRETTSVVMSQFKKDLVISQTNGKIVIVDFDKLRSQTETDGQSVSSVDTFWFVKFPAVGYTEL